MKLNMDFRSPEENFLLEFLRSGKRILIVTGEVNSGKTTAIEKFIPLLIDSGKKVGGFYTRGIIEAGKKSGFEIVDIITGKTEQLASINKSSKFMYRQGRFYFNPELFERYNRMADIPSDSEIFIIDEVGYMELNEGGFFPLTKKLLSSFKGKLIIVFRQNIFNELLVKLNINIMDSDLLSFQVSTSNNTASL